MTAENKVDYLEMPAKDLAVARSFFEALFGWQFDQYGADYIAFNDGRMSGGFYRSDNTVSVANGSVLVVFYMQNLEAACRRVEQLGATVTRDIFAFPGGSRFHFTDPNGNEYAVWSDK